MGWSCSLDADNTLRAISDICVKETGSQNTFNYKGSVYMFETGREQTDGAITGTITRLIENGTDEHGHKRYSGYRAGSFKILPDGSIKQFLRFKKVV